MEQFFNQDPEVTGGYLVQGTGSKIIGPSELFSLLKGIELSLEYPDKENPKLNKKHI